MPEAGLHPEPQPKTRRYAVFISYRHADNKEAGRQWATWLHQMLESYEVPHDLVDARNGRGEPIPASLYPVFRDEEELPADADLTQNIRRALESSGLLVVLCSPRAALSRFVSDEIRYFKELGKADRILALIIDGEPNASDKPAADSGAPLECFPEPLRFGVLRAEGAIDWTAPTEPIAADTRPGGQPVQGWTSSAAYRDQLQREGRLAGKEIDLAAHEYEQRLELAKLKIVAGALSVPLGTLTQRDKAAQLARARQRTRTLRRWLAAVVVLALVALGAGAIALRQRARADEQRVLAERNAARADANSKQAEANAHRATENLARSDFREGINRLSHLETSAEGIAMLARAARSVAHPAAMARLWTLFQQRQFWVPAAVSPTPLPQVPSDEKQPPDPKFATVEFENERRKPNWFSRSADGATCVVILNGSIVDGTTEKHRFRVFRADGTPVTAWLKVGYQGDFYVSSLRSARLSADGRYVAVVASPWREPEYLEVWDTREQKRVGEAIRATGMSSQHQSVSFSQVRFVQPKTAVKNAPALLFVASRRGDASVFAVTADEHYLRARNRHPEGVTVAAVDADAQWLMSISADRQLQVADLRSGDAIGHPFVIDRPVKSIDRVDADRLRVQPSEGEALDFRLTPRLVVSPPAGARLREKSAGNEPELDPAGEGGPNAVRLPKPGATLAVTTDGKRAARLMQSTELGIFSADSDQKEPVWSKRFSSSVFRARFAASDELLIVQTDAFVTEVWKPRADQRLGYPLDERRFFREGERPSKPLLSSVVPQHDRLLTRSFFWDPPNLARYWFAVWDLTSGLPVIDRLSLGSDGGDGEIDHAEFNEEGSFLLLATPKENSPKKAIQLDPPAEIRLELADAAEALGGLSVRDDGTFATVPDRMEKLSRLLPALRK